jgi:predicted mannosyl-3-phosphoglycerate phosphatase (HAD superfamily)
MISFLQFTKLDRELRAAALIENHAERLDYVSSYLDSFFKGVVSNALANLAARVAQRFEMGETVVISEYSRVIKEALKVLRGSRPAVFTSIRFLVVSRTGMLLVNDEPIRMIEELRKLGAEPEILTFGDWLGFLSGGSQVSRIGRVDKVLFGVEAFSVRGDVVYPQIVKEVDILRTRKTLGGPISKAIIMAVGEAYKVCRDDQEISRIIVDPYYTVMPSVAFDEIITDIGETQPELSGSTDLAYCARHVEDLVDEIRRVLWPKGTPLPVWNLPSHLRSSVRLIATDIDGTLTSNGSLGLGSLVRIAELAAIGIRVVLVTGRSAGWGYALSQYLPGVLAVVAENGAVLISQDYNDGTPTLLDGWTGDDRQKKMTDVAQCAHAVRQNYPFLTMSPDNFCRLTDIAFLLDPRINPDVVSEIARRHGVSHTFSSVHHHLSASELKKSTGLVLALTRTFDVSETELRESSLTVGDSVNDAPLFDSAIFAATVGVRGILPHLDKLAGSEPMYVTLRDASDGFIELTDVIMEAYQKVVLKM